MLADWCPTGRKREGEGCYGILGENEAAPNEGREIYYGLDTEGLRRSVALSKEITEAFACPPFGEYDIRGSVRRKTGSAPRGLNKEKEDYEANGNT